MIGISADKKGNIAQNYKNTIMKKYFLISLILMFYTNINAHDLPRFGEFVKSYENLVGYCKFSKYTMNSFISTNNLGSYCKKDIENSNSSYLTDNQKTSLIDYYNNIGYIEGVYLSELSFGINFAKDSNGAICIYAGSYFYSVTYNTNRTTELDRAKDAINSAIIPILQKGGKSLTDIGYDYVMIGMGYLKKHPQQTSEEGAAVYCIIPTKYIESFISLEITSDELIKNSKVYLKDVGDIKLINL